jgi:hypothetical protein
MKTLMVGGKQVSVPTYPDGSVSVDLIRQMSGIPANRPLVRQSPNGTNQVLNEGDMARVNPEDHITHFPLAERGTHT